MLLLPTESGRIGVRVLQGERVDAGYRYTFPLGAFFGYGYALLSFDIPSNALLGTTAVTAAAQEPSGCTATASTRFAIAATQARANQGVAKTLGAINAGRFAAPLALLSRSSLILSHTILPGNMRSMVVVGASRAVISTHGIALVVCQDTVVSSLSLRLTTAALLRVSGTVGYLPAGQDVCPTMLYVALRTASHPTVLATLQVTTGTQLEHVALLGGRGLLRGGGHPTSQDYVAAPGRYLLQLHLAPRTPGAHGTLTLWVAALAYAREHVPATIKP